MLIMIRKINDLIMMIISIIMKKKIKNKKIKNKKK